MEEVPSSEVPNIVRDVDQRLRLTIARNANSRVRFDTNTIGPASEDRILVNGIGIVANTKSKALFSVPDVGSIVNLTATDVSAGIGRRFAIVLASVVWLEVVRRDRTANVRPKLTSAFPALVLIEPIIAAIRRNGIFDINRAAKELDAIVRIREHFDMIDLSATPDPAQSQSVDLRVFRESRTAETNRNVAQRTRVVFGIRASKDSRRFR